MNPEARFWVTGVSQELFRIDDHVAWDAVGHQNERLMNFKTLQVFGSIHPDWTSFHKPCGWIARRYRENLDGPSEIPETEDFDVLWQAKDWVAEHAIAMLKGGR
jgi:hypothetical protein